jgi:hypothetical protein
MNTSLSLTIPYDVLQPHNHNLGRLGAQQQAQVESQRWGQTPTAGKSPFPKKYTAPCTPRLKNPLEIQ